jgi:hypothetical protein
MNNNEIIKNIRLAYGTNVYDVFFTPTIRFEARCEVRYLTIDWLKWYVGISWEKEV